MKTIVKHGTVKLVLTEHLWQIWLFIYQLSLEKCCCVVFKNVLKSLKKVRLELQSEGENESFNADFI